MCFSSKSSNIVVRSCDSLHKSQSGAELSFYPKPHFFFFKWPKVVSTGAVNGSIIIMHIQWMTGLMLLLVLFLVSSALWTYVLCVWCKKRKEELLRLNCVIFVYINSCVPTLVSPVMHQVTYFRRGKCTHFLYAHLSVSSCVTYVGYKFLSLSSFKIASAEPDNPVWLIVDVYTTCNRDVIWTTIHLSVRHKSYPNSNIPKRWKYLLTTNLTLEGKIGFVPHVDYYSLFLLAPTMCFVAAVLFSLCPTCTTYKTVQKMMTCVLKE